MLVWLIVHQYILILGGVLVDTIVDLVVLIKVYLGIVVDQD